MLAAHRNRTSSEASHRAGIDSKRVDEMEQRLRADVLAEADMYEGQTLVTDENDDLTTFTLRLQVSPDVVQTPQQVFEELREEGYDVVYARIPVTDEKVLTLCTARCAVRMRPPPLVYCGRVSNLLMRSWSLARALVCGVYASQVPCETPGRSLQAPKDSDFDRIMSMVEESPEESAYIFNCQMGRGRTTTGMVIAAAALLHRRGAVAAAIAGTPSAAAAPPWFAAGVQRSLTSRVRPSPLALLACPHLSPCCLASPAPCTQLRSCAGSPAREHRGRHRGSNESGSHPGRAQHCASAAARRGRQGGARRRHRRMCGDAEHPRLHLAVPEQHDARGARRQKGVPSQHLHCAPLSGVPCNHLLPRAASLYCLPPMAACLWLRRAKTQQAWCRTTWSDTAH